MKQDLEIKSQVKQILKIIEDLAPGRSVELRIPPYAAIQCLEGGNHRRGTPPNVVEMDAQTLLKLSKSPKIGINYAQRVQLAPLAQTQILLSFLLE
jgi:hypothetical protein